MLEYNLQFAVLSNPKITTTYDRDAGADFKTMSQPDFVVSENRILSHLPKFDASMLSQVRSAPDAGPYGDTSREFFPQVDPAITYFHWDTVPGSPHMPTDAEMLLVQAEYRDGSSIQARIPFYEWMDSQGYRVVAISLSIDNNGSSPPPYYFTNVFRKSATGVWTPCGKWQFTQADGDTAFGIAVSIAASVVGAGWVTAIGSATTGSGSITSAAISGAQAYAGADTGVSTMDFGETFAGFDYSSGEAAVAFSDAQNVDFGLGNIDASSLPDPMDITGWSPGDVTNESTFGSNNYSYGSTPEVTTNDFGTTWDNAFGDETIKTAVGGVKLAQSVSTPTRRSTVGQPSSRKPPTQSPDVVGSFRNVLQGIESAASAINVTAQQTTTAQRATYSGQLTPTGGAGFTVAGIQSNTIMIAGAALVAVALFLHLKG